MGEVGENGDFDGDAEGAELRHGMRSDLEDEEFGTGISDGAHTGVENADALGGHVFVLRV